MTAQFLQTRFVAAVCAISGVLAGSGTPLGLRLIAMRWKVSLPEFPKRLHTLRRVRKFLSAG